MQALLCFYFGKTDDFDVEVAKVFQDASEAWRDRSILDKASIWGIIRNLIVEEPDENMDVYINDLRNMPIDQVQYQSDNSKRQDVRASTDPDRFFNIENTFPWQKNEISYLLWNRNPYEIIRGGNSDSIFPGSAYTYPYWLARWNFEGKPDSPPVETTTIETDTTTAHGTTTGRETTTVSEPTTKTELETTSELKTTVPGEIITTNDPVTAGSFTSKVSALGVISILALK